MTILKEKGGGPVEKARQYFVEPAAFVKENLCYNDGLGITEEDGFLIDRRYFDNYVVMAVQKGKLHHCQCGRHLIAEPGEYVFADLHLPHRYWFDESEPGAILWTHINGGPAMQTAEKIAALSPLPFLGHGAQVPALLQNLLRQTEEGNGDVYARSTLLYRLLLAVLEESRALQPVGEAQAPAPEWVRRVEEAVGYFVYKPADLQKMAAYLGVSRYHLCHMCKKYLGQSPAKMLTTEKIRTARRHLLYTGDKVEVIAQRLCFSSVSYFSKVFKAETGLSPGVYRQKARAAFPPGEA